MAHAVIWRPVIWSVNIPKKGGCQTGCCLAYYEKFIQIVLEYWEIVFLKNHFWTVYSITIKNEYRMITRWKNFECKMNKIWTKTFRIFPKKKKDLTISGKRVYCNWTKAFQISGTPFALPETADSPEKQKFAVFQFLTYIFFAECPEGNFGVFCIEESNNIDRKKKRPYNGVVQFI